MDVNALLQHINERHGSAFSFLGRCAGGTHGAYELTEPQGRRAILKYGLGQEWLTRVTLAAAIAEPLRFIGYPIPRDLFRGMAPGDFWYQIQEFVFGTPMSLPLSSIDLDHLLALNELQANLCSSEQQAWPDWSGYVHDVIFAGASGWVDALQTYSGETRSLLQALHAAAQPYEHASLSGTDVVHGDFLPANVLLQDHRVFAVIDFSQAGCGTRAYDLARLLVWCYDDMDASLRGRLYERIVAIASPAERTLCLICQIIDLVAVMMTHHPEAVELCLHRGWRVLMDLRFISQRESADPR